MSENEMNRISDQAPGETVPQPTGLAALVQYGGLAAVVSEDSSDGGPGRILQSAILSSQNPGVISSPTPVPGVFSTTRRPSYTSKAPSALTHLPKTLEEIHDSPDSLPKLQELNKDFSSDKKAAGSDFHNGQRYSARDLLNLHGQASFESLEDYSNPGTPQSGQQHESDAPNSSGTSSVQKRERFARSRTEILRGQEWEAAARAEILTVRCRDHIGELHKYKFGSGSKGKCIKVNDKWHTPIEFESLSGRASCKDWKRSIRFHGHHLQRLIEDQFITLHAISCTCGVCCGDDTLTGPVKLFQTVKRKRSQVVGASVPGTVGFGGKRKSLSEEYRGFQYRSGSCNADNDVFPAGQDDAGMPPMTPVTPMTPITPHTPFGAACLTPMATSAVAVNFRPSSPPRSITLQVPVSQLAPVPRPTVHSSSAKIELPVPYSVPAGVSTAIGPTINNHVLGAADFSTLSQQHWIQLEETASNLVSMANKLKLMVEQTKIQCEAISNSAITQAKIQAESDKQEALLNLRRGQLLPPSINHAVVSMEQQAAHSQQFAVQVPRVCANCARDAYLECTGCYRMYYCGPFCQQRDWAVHKLKCREVAEDAVSQVGLVTADNK